MIRTLKIALNTLRRNKARTLLTVLGIVIGIAAVIIVMSAGEGVRSYIVDQVKTFGTDFIQVEIKVPSTSHVSSENAMGMAMGIEVTTLKISDAEAILKLPNIKNYYAGIIGQQLVSYGGNHKQAMIWGTSASFIDIDKTKVAQGRFYSDEEDRGLATVVVLGSKVLEKLFDRENPIDKMIKVGKLKFRVIGVMEERGSTGGFDMDNLVYLPVRTLQKKVMGVDYISFAFNQVYDNSIADETAAEITDLLRQRHGITDPKKDDFAVTTMEEMMKILDSVFGAINLLLLAIASISLIVGGVGIMNIMYVSVNERTYEIGLRKAVGATKFSILMQFLWEAVIVTMVGAIIGVILGVLFSFLVSVIANSVGFSWKFMITLRSLLIACGFSIVIGLVFGLWPARQAAVLDPITALRK